MIIENILGPGILILHTKGVGHTRDIVVVCVCAAQLGRVGALEVIQAILRMRGFEGTPQVVLHGTPLPRFLNPPAPEPGAGDGDGHGHGHGGWGGGFARGEWSCWTCDVTSLMCVWEVRELWCLSMSSMPDMRCCCGDLLHQLVRGCVLQEPVDATV
jgi:hypothetical protein